MKKLTPQDLQGLESFEVLELDQRSLRVVTTGTRTGTTDLTVNPIDGEVDGRTNGNCGCAPGSTYSGTPDNGNCGCG